MSSKDLEDIEENSLNVEEYKEDITEILLDRLEIYSDLSLDIIYISILKRVFKPSQKVLQNEK